MEAEYKIKYYSGDEYMVIRHNRISFGKHTIYIDNDRIVWYPNVISLYEAKYQHVKSHYDVNDLQLVAKLVHCRVSREYLENEDPEKHVADSYAEELYYSRIYELFGTKQHTGYHYLTINTDEPLLDYHLRSVKYWQRKIMKDLADNMKQQNTTPDKDICIEVLFAIFGPKTFTQFFIVKLSG